MILAHFTDPVTFSVPKDLTEEMKHENLQILQKQQQEFEENIQKLADDNVEDDDDDDQWENVTDEEEEGKQPSKRAMNIRVKNQPKTELVEEEEDLDTKSQNSTWISLLVSVTYCRKWNLVW